VSPEHAGPAWIALRAAALGVDDVSRAALREWVRDGLDFRGDAVAGFAAPSEPATQVIAAGLLALERRERCQWRIWMMRWTDYTGRIITPSEKRHRNGA
jgi:hypothetical protein